jgi:hypothetical protein
MTQQNHINATNSNSSQATATAAELYVVMDGGKIAGIYQWKADAREHAAAVAGTVIVQQVRYELPGWVATMVKAAKDKAIQQAGRKVY